MTDLLTNDQRITARQLNTRARQIFWHGIVADTCPIWNMTEDSIIDWVLDFQASHRLLQDGYLGPSSLIAMMSDNYLGIGGFIIDGKEIQVENTAVARMFTPNHTAASVTPDLCCILSIPEMDRAARDRISGRAKVRAHFSIDSSAGCHGQSLIIQWADPLREVPFCPLFETTDYPRRRQCIGIELENVLLLYQLDSDERRWRKRRPVIKAAIGKKEISQPALYETQIKAMSVLLDVLHKNANIPKSFPSIPGRYCTDILCDNDLKESRGYLAKFNYLSMNNEPGAGIVPWLSTLFGEPEQTASADINETPAAAISTPASTVSLAHFDAQVKELAETPQPTSAFRPTHEDGPRFSLSNAIAAAYQSGKAARASRIADKSKKFDDTM